MLEGRESTRVSPSQITFCLSQWGNWVRTKVPQAASATAAGISTCNLSNKEAIGYLLLTSAFYNALISCVVVNRK